MIPFAFHFFRRTYPSANMVLVHGKRPVLVDSGFGADSEETRHLLREVGTPPERLALIVNSHYHCDHAGGNGPLQKRYGTPVAAHRWEAALVNHRDPEACTAEWLVQPIEPYRITRPLSEGDKIETGEAVLEVVETPGHTLGHISLYDRENGALIGGDLFHAGDVAWLNPFREGSGAILRAMESLEKLARLKISWACSGHGPAMEDPKSTISAALRRYEKWLDNPEKAAWHACKRILAYELMLSGGHDGAALRRYLLDAPWFCDYARHAFGAAPQEFVEPLVDEMLRSKAAEWREGKLVARAPFSSPPPAAWPQGPARPKSWPRAEASDPLPA